MLLKPDISFHVFDDKRWVVHTPDGRNILVNEASYQLLEILKSNISLIDANKAFNEQFQSNSSLADFKEYLAEIVGGYGILQEDTDTPRPNMKNQYLKLKVELIPAKVTGYLVKPFLFLYRPLFFWSTFLGFITCIATLIFILKDTFKDQKIDVALVGILFYGSMLVHELGHIGACASNKLKHGGIGFGFYFIMPVMYADITNIWLANKHRRIIANLAGIHNELFYATVLMLLGCGLHNNSLLVAGIGIATFTVWEFNPFVRFDGYWILSDLTNTPNLIAKSQVILTDFFKQIIKKRFVIPLNQVWLLLYGAINYLFVWGFMVYILSSSWGYMLSFPSLCVSIWEKVLQGENIWNLVDRRLFAILTFYLLALKFLVQYIQKSYRLGSKGSA